MCDRCDPHLYDSDILYDYDSKSWYLDIETGEWNTYNDDFIHQRVWINYCPWCGRKLPERSPEDERM